MTFRKFRLLILFLSFFCLGFSQVKDSTGNWIIKANATSLIDIFTFPTVQISVEKRIVPALSVNAEFGYQLYDFRVVDTVFLKPKGFKANMEFRFYLSEIMNSDIASYFKGMYVGLQGFYRKNQYSTTIGYRSLKDSSMFIDDGIGVKKLCVGINCMMGFEEVLTGHIVFDTYIGLGGMNRIVKNTNVQFKSGEDHLGGVDMVPYFQHLNLSESSGASISLIFGIRVGIKF